MSGKIVWTAMVVTTVYAGSITFSLAGKDDMGGGDDKGDRIEKVELSWRCSLNGITAGWGPRTEGCSDRVDEQD